MKEFELKNLFHETKVPESLRFGVYSIEDASKIWMSSHLILNSLLSEKEIEIFESLSSSKRKNEWLAGRLASKQAVYSYLQESGDLKYNTISILNDKDRAPFIDGRKDLTLSISHSNKWAVAVVAPFSVGIDIEYIEHRSSALIDYFFHEDERAAITKNPKAQDDRLTFLWTRKEAASKAVRKGGNLVFKNLETLNESITLLNQRLRLRSMKSAGYWLSLAFQMQ